jgi:hypothetical protein
VKRPTTFEQLQEQYRELQGEYADSANHSEKVKAALTRILAEPYGCAFCDSGKLRNLNKDHDYDCGYAMARAVLGKEKDNG